VPTYNHHEKYLERRIEDVMSLEVVKDYYDQVLKTSKDLKTSTCCEGRSVPAHLEPLLANVHEEGVARGPGSSESYVGAEGRPDEE
jgi:hypothetical protein